MKNPPPELIEFLHKHPEKAILMLHHRQKQPRGMGMAGAGFTFKKLLSGIKKIGSHPFTKTAYKGAKYFYDYTNGLPFTASEKLAKKLFKTDLRKFKTYKDAKKAYGYMMQDPRKYEDIYKAIASPKKTAQKLAKTTAQVGPSAVIGGITGGPAGAAKSVGGVKLTEDLWKDYSTLYPEDKEVPEFAKKQPAKPEKKLKKKKPKSLEQQTNMEGTGVNWKKGVRIASNVNKRINPVEWGVEGFMKNNPEIARKIIKITNKIKGQGLGLAGGGLSKTAKKILTAAGVLGTAGALGFAGYLMNKPGPVTYPQLEHNIHFDLEDWDPSPMEEEWVAGDGFSNAIDFVKKHKNKALAILLGVATVGAVAAGEAAFRNKFEGTASTSSDGRAIIKHLVSGSDKKLETDKLIMHGPNIVQRFGGTGLKTAGMGLKRAGDGLKTAGMGLKVAGGCNKGSGLGLSGGALNSKIKTALVSAGIAAVPAAILFAKWALKNPDANIDDFGDISAEEHYKMFGDGIGTSIMNFARKSPNIAKKIMKVVKNDIQHTAKTLTTPKLLRAQLKREGKEYKNLITKPKYLKSRLEKEGKAWQKLGKNIAGTGTRKIGSKREVWNGTALKTSGGLRKEDLIKNKRGKIVSKKKHELGKSKAQYLKPISKNNGV